MSALTAHVRALTLALLLVLAAACGPHRPRGDASGSSAPSAAPGSEATAQNEAAPYVAPVRMAFAVDARVLVEDVESRKMKLRFYGHAPDRFRIEVRGPVGGIALVATGRAGRIRLVVPSRRRYAEGTMTDDLAAGLVGVPMTGCDLAMVVRISSGFKKFHPCGETTPDEDTPVTANDRAGLIVDTNTAGDELVRFGWDWSGDGTFPKEMRVESLKAPQTSLALTGFKALEPPAETGEDFYWEPYPEGATLVPLGEIGDDVER